MAYAMSSGRNAPDHSPPSTVTASPTPKVAAAEQQQKQKKMNQGRHHRSSSLENNILMSSFNIAPFSGNKPQLSIAAEPPPATTTTAASTPSPGSGGSSSLTAPSPFQLRYQSPQYHPPHHHHHHHHPQHHSSQPHSLQLLSQPNELLGGQKLSPFRIGGGGGGTALGGQSPLQPYYGTLKSKREQKRMQMGQKTGTGHCVGTLQQRISSVDDLRPGNSNSISKSQVRLMREMFEQQQQRSNGANQSGNKSVNNNQEQNQSQQSKNKTTSLATNNNPGNDTVDCGKQPPAIQPCSGVLEMNKPQLIKPIAFKPIPFPADSRFNQLPQPHHQHHAVTSHNNPANHYEPNDRYGSTPSLNPPPPINYNLKFGSTHDLRHNFGGSRKGYSFNYDSISPDSICSQSTLKSLSHYQDNLLDTPSPSDSGISELEAALRDRDSELSYLRQTMEHNEKVIFRVHQDKERNWEEEIKRMRAIHAQRIEQIAMMQSFQLKQAKKRHHDEVSQLQARIKDVERKAELQHTEILTHKVNEKELREQCADLAEENELMRKLVNELRSRLEESEWSNCQKNGESALLKSQLKEAQSELMHKDQEIAQLRVELKMHRFQASEDNDHLLVLPANEPEESAIIITTNNNESSGSSSSATSSPVSINHHHSDDLQMSHLNRIIILKDQIIMAMTNETQKLKKELADLGNYEGLPPGRGGGVKKRDGEDEEGVNNVILGDYHDLLNNLKNSEDFLKCTTKERPTLEELKNVLLNNQFGVQREGGGREKVAINHLQRTTNCAENCDEKISSEPKRTNLETKEGEHEQLVRKLQGDLAEMKKSFDEERKRWTEEKEKVLVYQRQLQKFVVSKHVCSCSLPAQVS